MRINKIIRHTEGRCRSLDKSGTDIYGARGWGKTRSNVFISIIAHLRSKSRGQADSVLLYIPYDSSHVTAYKEQSN